MAMRSNPFDEMERMMEQMRQSFGGWGDWSDFSGPMRGSGVSLETDDEGYVVLADLPGFEKEELDLRFEDGVLAIRAEHENSDEYEGAAGSAYSSRRRHFHERVHVPAEIREDEISASYRNGVLEVHLPTVEDVDDDSHVIDIE